MSNQRRKQPVGTDQLIRLEGSSTSKRSSDGLNKEGLKRMKSLTSEEIIIGKNHVNPALILHLAKSTKEDGISRNKMNAIISQALRQLKSEKTGTEKAWFMSLVTLAKLKSELFTSDRIVEVLCSYLERDPSQILHKGRNSSLVPVLSWSLLMTAYKKHDNWPEEFVRVYVKDAISDRLWCDHQMCRQYCQEITKVFGTIKPSTTSPTSGLMGPSKPDTDPMNLAHSDDSQSSKGGESSSSLTENHTIITRYKNSAVQESIKQFVVKTVSDYITQKKSVDNMTRNFVKFLCTSCGLQEIRQLAVTKLDAFLNSTKLSRPALDLLSHVAANTKTGSAADVEVVKKLALLRIKSKPMVNFYTTCLRELMTLQPTNIEHLMRTVIMNELGSGGGGRNTTNMQLLAAFVQQDGDKSAIFLAIIFQELLLQPDDYLRALRLLLREIVRSVHYEFKFSQFALSLMQEVAQPNFRNMNAQLQERMFLSLNSIICMTILLSCKPSIRDIAMSSTKTDVLPLIKFQNDVAVMQKNAVWWLHKIVPAQYRVMGKHYYNSLRQVLFLDDPVNYANKDNWPSDTERNTLVSLCAEVPLLENTLMRLGVLGTANNLPLRPQEVLGIIDNVVRRAAMLDIDPPLLITGQTKYNLDIIQMLIRLSEYKNYNTTVKFPEGYTPPQLVISSHYWMAWQILLVLAAFNPTTVGALGWNKHPTLKGFMEMVITNNYTYPPSSMNYQDAMVLEKQLSAAEESEILIFEGHLAAPQGIKITKHNSQFINQLLVVKEGGPMRRPPETVLKQFRLLAMELQLKHRLCKVREPDFLLDIIKQQGTSKSMSWLSELVKSSENSFELLPVPSLCEFLLQDTQNSKKHTLLKRLQSILNGTSDPNQAQEIVAYFISKMSATYSIRSKALKGLKTIFNRPHDDHQSNEDWLLVDLVNIPLHATVNSIVCTELRKALEVEQSLSLIGAYLVYLCKHCCVESKLDTTIDIASSIINRHHIMFRVLEANEDALVALLDNMLSITLSSKHVTKDGASTVSLKINGKTKHLKKEVIQADLVLLAHARGRNVGSNQSVSKLKEALFNSETYKQLQENSEILCTNTLHPILLGSGMSDLENLAMKSMTPSKMVNLLHEFSLPETAAQFILQKLDEDIENVKPVLEEDLELLAHVQAWRINVSAGDKIEEFLMSKSVVEVNEEIDFYAEKKIKEEKMETDDEDTKHVEWSKILKDIFENDSAESQSCLLTYCIENKNIEEICLTLFLWFKDHQLLQKHEQFLTVIVQILAANCSNMNLLEKLLTTVSPYCVALIPLHLKLFPLSCKSGGADTNRFSSLLEWCKDPKSQSFTSVLREMKSIDIKSVKDKSSLGSVWKKVLKTSISNCGNYGIEIQPLIKVVVSKMIENPESSGIFMDWLQVLSPELDCFTMFLDTKKSVPVSLQRYILNMICSSSGWGTLHKCIDYVLSSKTTGFEESLILDFLQGCCNSERSWQGANSQRGTDKGSLKLNSDQLWRLCLLIMSEVSKHGDQQDKQFILLSWRLPLILSPFHKHFLPDLVTKLQYYPNKCSKLLTLSLYLAEPAVFSNGAAINIISSALSCTDTATSCDALIHQLINNVCDNKKNSASGYVLLRRLAYYHPPFILRHIDLLTSALGTPTANTSKNEFIKADYGSVFISIIGILESLGSHLFKVDVTKILRECLEFAVHHTKKDIRLYTPVIIKLCQIFLLFLEKDRSEAMKLFDREYIDKLTKMESRIRDPTLTKLLDCIVKNGAPGLAEFDESSMAPYLAKLSSDSTDCMTILHDLDAGSIKKPAVLKMFLHEICRRMTSDQTECRNLAHRLAIRHVRQSPKDSSIVYSYIEQALQSPHHDVIKSVVTEIPELVLLSGSEGPKLMRLVFSAVSASNIDMMTEFMIIVKTVITSSDLF